MVVMNRNADPTMKQRRFIERLVTRYTGNVWDLLAEVHKGGYDMYDMPSVFAATRYLTRAEASEVIDRMMKK